MFQKLDALMRAAFELLFPGACCACDGLLESDSAAFCAACAITLEPVITSCPKCALPWPTPVERPPPCIACLMRPPRVEAAFAPYQFGGALAQAVRRLKWSRLPELARPLGELLADGLTRAGPAMQDVDLVAPVPLHPKRLRVREFNQAAALAHAMAAAIRARDRALARRLRVDTSVLLRVRDTPPQTGLGRAQRRANVLGAFEVRAVGRVRGRRILLVDDVLTTGATVDACAGALLDAGAAAVLVLTLGRAVT
jgi:ComF family protein